MSSVPYLRARPILIICHRITSRVHAVNLPSNSLHRDIHLPRSGPRPRLPQRLPKVPESPAHPSFREPSPHTRSNAHERGLKREKILGASDSIISLLVACSYIYIQTRTHTAHFSACSISTLLYRKLVKSRPTSETQ